VAPDEDENIYSEVELRPPSEGGGKRGFDFYCSVIARSVLCDVAISSTCSVIARSAATWQSHLAILSF